MSKIRFCDWFPDGAKVELQETTKRSAGKRCKKYDRISHSRSLYLVQILENTDQKNSEMDTLHSVKYCQKPLCETLTSPDIPSTTEGCFRESM